MSPIPGSPPLSLCLDSGVSPPGDIASLARPSATAPGVYCGDVWNTYLSVLGHGQALPTQAKGHGQGQHMADLCHKQTVQHRNSSCF